MKAVVSSIVHEDPYMAGRQTAFEILGQLAPGGPGSGMGHQAVFASNGQEAVEIALAGPFDLVLMDCQMPLLDGYQATRALRSAPAGQKLPILALTAQTLPGDRDQCFAAGMDGYVPKPFNREMLAAEIARVLRVRGSAAAERMPSRPATESGLLSPKALEQLRGMNRRSPATAAQIVDLFRTEGTRILADLEAAAVAAEIGSISRLNHELLGSAGMIGAARVEAQARALEDHAKALDFAAVLAFLPEIERDLAETARLFEGALST